MICKHCAYPNDPQDQVCGKCHRALQPSSGQPRFPSPTPNDPQSDESMAASQSNPAHTAVNPTDQLQEDKPLGFDQLLETCLKEADRKVQAGDLRGAFIICQAFVMDHYGDLPEQAMLSLYTTMGEISKLQGKTERAAKYLQKADMIRSGLGPTGIPQRISVNPPDDPIESYLGGDLSQDSAKQDIDVDEMEDINEPIELDRPSQATAGPKPAVRIKPPDQAADGHSFWTAGFFVRLVSFIADALIVTTLVFIMALLSSAVLDEKGQNTFQLVLDQPSTLFLGCIVWMLLIMVYHFIFAKFGGQSLGKAFLKIRIVDLNGGHVSTKKAIFRSLGLLAAGIPALGGFFWVGFDMHRRGFHDYLGGTLVVQINGRGKKRLGIF